MNPYHTLNLTHNPFGELSQAKRVQLACIDKQLLAKLSHAFIHENTILQFVADHGRGKSTHLLSLHAHVNQLRFQQRAQQQNQQPLTPIPYIQISDDQPLRWPHVPAYFVDSIECLNLVERLRLYKKYPQLAVTTHRDLSTQMRFMGRQVVSIAVTQTDPNRLQQIFTARVTDAVLNRNDTLAYPSTAVMRVLRDHCDNDIRAMEAILYDIYHLLSLSRPKNDAALLPATAHLKLTSTATNHTPTAISGARASFDMATKIVNDMGEHLFDWKTIDRKAID